MMIVQYLLDSDERVVIPGVEAPQTDFADVVEPVRLALEQEKRVTEQISDLTKLARDGGRPRRRAVPALVPAGAARGDLVDGRAADRRRALARQRDADRGLPRARGRSGTKAPTRARRRPQAERSSLPASGWRSGRAPRPLPSRPPRPSRPSAARRRSAAARAPTALSGASPPRDGGTSRCRTPRA